MKGLLLKDWYLTIKYCKMYLLVDLFFIIGSVFDEDNYVFFVLYPAVMSGIMSSTLLGYDERAKWDVYCGAFPLTKAQIVSEKYIVGMIMQAILLALMIPAQLARMAMRPDYGIRECVTVLVLLIFISGFSTAFCLPFLFKLGTEKGRIVHMFTIALVCGGTAAASFSVDMEQLALLGTQLIIPLILVFAIVLYACSWYLSIYFYRKRNI